MAVTVRSRLCSRAPRWASSSVDVVLARMDGLEVLRAVKDMVQRPRVLVLSGFVRGNRRKKTKSFKIMQTSTKYYYIAKCLHQIASFPPLTQGRAGQKDPPAARQKAFWVRQHFQIHRLQQVVFQQPGQGNVLEDLGFQYTTYSDKWFQLSDIRMELPL